MPVPDTIDAPQFVKDGMKSQVQSAPTSAPVPDVMDAPDFVKKKGSGINGSSTVSSPTPSQSILPDVSSVASKGNANFSPANNFGMPTHNQLAQGLMAPSESTVSVAPKQAVQAQYNQENIPKWNKEKEDYKQKVFQNTPTAIKNAAVKSLQIKGIDPNNAAQLNKAEQGFQQQVSNGDATVGFDKDGTPGLIKNPGFWSSLSDHMNDAINENKNSREYHSMGKQDRINFLNQQLKTAPSEYIGTKPTALGSVGGLIGGTIPTLGLYAAGAGIGGVMEMAAPETGGLSNLALKPAMSFVTNAGSEANKAELNGQLQRYAQIKKTNPTISDSDAFDEAQKGTDVDRLAGIGQAGLFSETGGVLGKSVTGNFLKEMGKAGVDIGAKSAAVEGAKDLGHNYEGVTNKSGSDILGDMAKSFGDNAPVGVALHGFMGAITGVAKVPDLIKSGLKYDVVTKIPPQEVQGELQKNVQSGAITPQEAQIAEAKLNEFSDALKTVPTYLPDDVKASVTGLILKRDNLIKSSEGLDPTAKDLAKPEIDGINNQIQEIYKTGKPLQSEIDPSTGTTYEPKIFDAVQQKNVDDLAKKISSGKPITDPQELQTQANFPQQLETSLRNIQKSETPTDGKPQSDALKNVNQYLKNNETSQAENKVPITPTQAGASNEGVNEVKQPTEESPITEQVKPFVNEVTNAGYKAIFENGEESDVNDALKEIAQQANASEAEKGVAIKSVGQNIVDIAQQKFPDEKTNIKPDGDLAQFEKQNAAAEQQPIVNSNGEKPESKFPKPDKPIHEMNGDELYSYSQKVRAHNKGLEVEFFGKEGAKKYREAQSISNNYLIHSSDPRYKEANALIDKMENSLTPEQRDEFNGMNAPDGLIYDDSEIRDISHKVRLVEESENADELSTSVKNALSGFKKDNPSIEKLAILNAAKKKAVELNIDPKDLIKKVLEKVGGQYKDIEDAGFMMKNAYDNLTKSSVRDEKGLPTISKEQPKDAVLGEEVVKNGARTFLTEKPNNIKSDDKSGKWYKYEGLNNGEQLYHSSSGFDYDANGDKLPNGSADKLLQDNKKIEDAKSKKEAPKTDLVNSIINDEKGWRSKISESKNLSELENVENELKTNVKLKAQLLGQDGKDFYSRLNYLKSHPDIVEKSTEPSSKEQPIPDKAEGNEQHRDLGQRAREEAQKYREGKKNVLPSFLRLDLPEGTKKAGIDINTAWANALDAFAAVHDVTKDFAKAIEAGYKHIKDWFDENKVPFDEQKIKQGFEDEMKGGSAGNEPPIIASNNDKVGDEGIVTGVKKAVTSEVRTQLGLPKVDLPKLGSDHVALNEAKERVDNGTVNPRDLVSRILDNKEGYKNEGEVMDMQYYSHQLNVKMESLKKEKSLTSDENERAVISGTLQQLSDEMDRQTRASQIAGNQWSGIGNRMQVVIDDGFNPSREKVFIEDAYGGEMPDEVKSKFDALVKERDDAIDAKNKIEEAFKQRAAKEGVGRIRKEAEKSKKIDETKEKLKKEEKELLDQVKSAFKRDLKNLNSGIPIPAETLEVLGKLAVNYFKQGAVTVESLVDKMYNALKDDVDGLDKDRLRDIISEYKPLSIEMGTSRLNKKADNIEDLVTPPTLKSKNGKLLGVNKPTDVTSAPKEKPMFRNNTEWVKAQQRVANAEYKMKVLKRQAFESKKNMYQKSLMWAARMFRLSVLSGTNVLYKLSSAATIGGAGLRVPSEAVGSMWSGIFKSLAEKAPIEGGFNVKAQAKFMTEFFNPKKFGENAWQILKTGQSNLSKRFGSAEYEHVPILYLPTDLHQVIKDPVKRGIFESSMIKSMAWAEKNGLDINDNLVYQSLENAAYKRANYEIFQESNQLSRKFQEMKAKLDKGGDIGATGKFLVDFMIPVSTVPTNIVRRLITTSPAGLVRGLVQVRNAYAKGIESLDTEQADKVMRQLKQGSLGTALYLTGWFAASHFGGLYSKFNPDKKRREGELPHDQMEIGGTMYPKPIQHALPFEIIQFAATARHVYDNYVQNKRASTFEATYNAGLASIGALLEQVPIVETGVHAVEATKDPYQDKKLKEDVERRFEPQILRETGVIPPDEKPERKGGGGGATGGYKGGYKIRKRPVRSTRMTR